MLINRKKVMQSIWLMLPISIVIMMVMALFFRAYEAMLVIPVAVLTYGAVIWIPSVVFTNLLEFFIINEKATEKTVVLTFAFETFVTFFVILFIFGTTVPVAPILAIIMSVIIQFCRWDYLMRKDRMYMFPNRKNDTNKESKN